MWWQSKPAKIDKDCSDGIVPCSLIQLHLEMRGMIRHEACIDHMEALGVGYFLLTNVIV